MEKIAFVMTLLPGHEAEYKKRHDEIWPDLVLELKHAGVHDYSIYFDEESHKLFAVLKRSASNTIDDLPLNPVVKKWWKYMADIMETHGDNEPISTPLKELFHLD